MQSEQNLFVSGHDPLNKFAHLMRNRRKSRNYVEYDMAEDVCHLLTECGRTTARRNTFYNIWKVSDYTWSN